MQVVLLAAGQSSRFYPFSQAHKSEVTLLGKPIIVHTLEAIKKVGITDVIIVVSPKSTIKDLVGNGRSLGLSIQYVVQENPNGMGDALLQAESFLKELFFVTHAHHVDFAAFANALIEKQKHSNASVLLAKKADHFSPFGVLHVTGDKVIDVFEKPTPEEAPSKLRIIGVYLLTREFINTLKKEKRGHYNFESGLSTFAKSHDLRVIETDETIISLKYPWDVFSLNDYLLQTIKSKKADDVQVGKNVVLEGNVFLEPGVNILEGAIIKGPCFIGKNTVVGNNAILRGGVSVSENCVIGAYMEIKHSILMNNTTTHSGFIGDSIIGAHCKIAAGFYTANVRLDRKTVKVKVKNQPIDTQLPSLGVIMGHDCKIGIRVTTMPGIIIGAKALIGPTTTVFSNVDGDTAYYTRFEEVVSEKKKHNQSELTETEEKTKEKIILFDIDYTLFNTDIFKESGLTKYSMYDEVVSVLEQVASIARLGIFSEGEMDFQTTKLIKTEIQGHFPQEHIHIVSNKDDTLEEVLHRYKAHKLYLVDDKLSVLFAAKTLLPTVTTIWIRRGPYAVSQKPIENFDPDAIIQNLNEILPILMNS